MRIGLRNLVSEEKKAFARTMRKRPTYAERTLWGALRRKALGVRFHRQAILRGYIADFYCPSEHLVVEVDGNHHLAREKYDATRDAALAAIGIKTIRFSNREVLSNIEGVVTKIHTHIGRKSGQARKGDTL